MKYLKLIHEISQKHQYLYGSSRITSILKAYQEVTAIRKHHSNIIEKYSLGTLDGIAIQYQQSVIAKKNQQIMKQYENIIEIRVRQRRMKEIANFGNGIMNEVKEISAKQLGVEQQQIYSLNSSSIKEIVEQKYQEFKIKDSLKKYADPKQFILKIQSYSSRIHSIALGYVKLYHESIQSLLEGKREVMQDENFQFEDGTKVKDKMNNLESFLRSKLPKFRNKHPKD